MQVRITSARAILIIGLCLLGFSVYKALATYSFLLRAVPATGTVWYGSRRMFFVEIAAPDGSPRYIPTHTPLLALPWSYVHGNTVTILYDPAMAYNHTNPFDPFPERARVYAWFHLWLPCLFTGVPGLLLLSLGCLQVAHPQRWRTSISVHVRH
jgi:hypothetical protein